MSNEDGNNEDKSWVRIVAVGGYSFVVQRDVATRSGTLSNMLSESSNFAEAVSGTVHIDERAAVVEKVIEYLTYKRLYENGGREEIPDFTQRIPPEIALELLMLADFLET